MLPSLSELFEPSKLQLKSVQLEVNDAVGAILAGAVTVTELEAEFAAPSLSVTVKVTL